MKFCKKSLAAITLTLASLMASHAWADIEDQTQHIVEAIAKIDPNMTVGGVFESGAEGIYGATVNEKSVIYFTKDAEYLLAGTLIHNTGDEFKDLTEETLKNLKSQSNPEPYNDRPTTTNKTSAAVNESDEPYKSMAQSEPIEATAIVYEATGEKKGTIEVFTDTSCPFCRSFHGQVDELNKKGVEVRYYAFARYGPGSAAHINMSNAVCATDPQEAFTQAMKGNAIMAERDTTYCEQIVQRHGQHARSIPIKGTPTIVLENGQIITGSRPTSTILQMMGI